MSSKYPHANRPEPDASSEEEEQRNYRQSMRWAGFGIELIGVMGLFTYAGYLADERWHTRPWLMLGGMLLAFTGMMYLLWKETGVWRK